MCRKLLLSITMPNDVFLLCFRSPNPWGRVNNTFRRCAKMFFSVKALVRWAALHLRRTMARGGKQPGKYFCALICLHSGALVRCGVWREIDNSINLCHLTSGSHASRSRFQPKTNLNSHSRTTFCKTLSCSKRRLIASFPFSLFFRRSEKRFSSIKLIRRQFEPIFDNELAYRMIRSALN